MKMAFYDFPIAKCTTMVYNAHKGGFLMPNVIDKYTPTYDLESFKQSKYEIKMSAIRGSFTITDFTLLSFKEK